MIIENYRELVNSLFDGHLHNDAENNEYGYSVDGTYGGTKETFMTRIFPILEKNELEYIQWSTALFIFHAPRKFLIEEIITNKEILTKDVINIVAGIMDAPEIILDREKVFKMTEDEYLMWRMKI